ncbi:RsbRD N-terminal domain-containing protein [Calditrichota bacterium]
MQKFRNFEQSEILTAWSEAVLAEYSAEGARFLAGQKDRFLNPVGFVLNDGLAKIVEFVLSGNSDVSLDEALEDILRIRAVQNFEPSAAMKFLVDLKKVLRQKFDAPQRQNGDLASFQTIEDRIDSLLLIAFDIYSRHREKISEIRIQELKRQMTPFYQREC